ncbi:hydrolase [Dactylosporangium roseum]|uniref:alpha/beta hydrolase family protein n=1 Tax=Dactylosporangium roseum TaxID=47989 RepID=UPI0031D80C2A
MPLLVGIVVTSGLPMAAAPRAAASAPPTVQLRLPAPTGRHGIGTVSLHLVDPSRPDPWVPTQPFRELMIQLWYPAAAVDGYPLAPWLEPATVAAYEQSNGLPAGVLSWPSTHANVGAPMARHAGRRPVVLYSHGLGGGRTENTGLVEDLASHGYIVVAIDHIHDARVVGLPDGRLETTAIPELTHDNELRLTTQAVDARVRDTRFVLDQLAAINGGDNPDAERRPLPRGLRGTLDLNHIGMFGHSDGGATTAAAMHLDSRISAGVNLDGTLWTPEARAGSTRPLLLFGKQNLDPFQANTWAAFWASHRGPKLRLSLIGSTHATFEDVAVLVPQAASTLGISAERLAAAFGAIDGQRAIVILRAYLKAYFDVYLRHRGDRLLNGPTVRYPEVQFVC